MGRGRGKRGEGTSAHSRLERALGILRAVRTRAELEAVEERVTKLLGEPWYFVINFSDAPWGYRRMRLVAHGRDPMDGRPFFHFRPCRPSRV